MKNWNYIEGAKTGNAWVGVKKSNGTYMPVEEGFYYRINGKRVGVLEINGNQLKLSDGRTININDIKNIEAGNKAGNSRVGNRDIHMSSSNSGELWLSDNGEGEMYDPIELGRYDFSGKSEALSVARELEQLKRKAEQKVKDADKFINAIKQWAAGLK